MPFCTSHSAGCATRFDTLEAEGISPITSCKPCPNSCRTEKGPLLTRLLFLELKGGQACEIMVNNKKFFMFVFQ